MLSELAERARRGNKTAEEQLFDKLLVRFRFFLTRRIGEEKAADLAQEACIIVLENYRMEKFTVSFDAWSYGVLKNVLRNHWRTERTKKKHESEMDDNIIGLTGSNDKPREEFVQIVLDCLRKIAKMNRRYARILLLKKYGYTNPEISEKLHITINNVGVILNRGRMMLRRCVETGELS